MIYLLKTFILDLFSIFNLLLESCFSFRVFVVLDLLFLFFYFKLVEILMTQFIKIRLPSKDGVCERITNKHWALEEYVAIHL